MLPDSQAKLSYNTNEARLAAFIVGCLVFDEIIIIDETDHKPEQMNHAIRLIAACLRETRAIPREADSPLLPFDY